MTLRLVIIVTIHPIIHTAAIIAMMMLSRFFYRTGLSFGPSRPVPARFEELFGAIVESSGPRMLGYKGMLDRKNTDREVIFQGVHQVVGSDLGRESRPEEERQATSY